MLCSVPGDLVASVEQQSGEDIQVKFDEVLSRQGQQHQAQDITCWERRSNTGRVSSL